MQFLLRTAGVTNFLKSDHKILKGEPKSIPISAKLSKNVWVPYTQPVCTTSNKHKNKRLEVHLESNTVKSKMPPLNKKRRGCVI